MKILNVIDEQGRFVKCKFYNGKSGQEDSYTYSVFHQREMLKEIGQTMGLENTYEQSYNINKENEVKDV